MNQSPALDAYLQHVLDKGASDLHLEAGAPPAIRLRGSIHFLEEPPLENEQLEEILLPVLDEHRAEIFLETGNVDFSYEIPDMARFRANYLLHHRGVGGVFRIIPSKIPSLEDLHLPKALADISNFQKGLVIVTGPTGSGKSTTLAAMVDYINRNRSVHVITIEDPIEFVHKSKKALIQQREIGTHARTFSAALRAALRESPDIVLVGEMRDLETITEAIRAAETGHLVFGTLHTNSAAKTIDRLIDAFPVDQQAQVRTMLSESLRGVIAQQLIPKKNGEGRAVAVEVLVGNNSVANLIREGKTYQIPMAMQTGKKDGMRMMDISILELYEKGVISKDEAVARSINKSPYRGDLAATEAGMQA